MNEYAMKKTRADAIMARMQRKTHEGSLYLDGDPKTCGFTYKQARARGAAFTAWAERLPFTTERRLYPGPGLSAVRP